MWLGGGVDVDEGWKGEGDRLTLSSLPLSSSSEDEVEEELELLACLCWAGT